MTPPEAAPMREDVMQAEMMQLVRAMAEYSAFVMPAQHGAVVCRDYQVATDIAHRLTHTARPDAPNLNSYIDGYEDAQEVAARPDAGDEVERDGRFLLDRLVDYEVRMTSEQDAREWYGHVTPAMARFRTSLAAMREGVDRGMHPGDEVGYEIWDGLGAISGHIAEEVEGWYRVQFADGSQATVRPSALSRKGG